MGIRSRLLFGFVLALAVSGPLVLVVAEPAGVPTEEQCRAEFEEIGIFKFGLEIGKFCSGLTNWWPGNKDKCCKTLEELLGNDGTLGLCMCTERTTSYLSGKFDDILVDITNQISICEGLGISIPRVGTPECTPAQTENAEEAAAVQNNSPVPTEEVCAAQVSQIGTSELISSLAACLFGASDSCCQNVVGLVGPGGRLSYCLCHEDATSALEVQAAEYGVDVNNILTSCVTKSFEVPFSWNQYCPVAPSSASRENLLTSYTPQEMPVPPATSDLIEIQGQSLTLPERCTRRVSEIRGTVMDKLSPCWSGVSTECCRAITDVVGTAGDLENCLCDQSIVQWYFDYVDLFFQAEPIVQGCLQAGFEVPFLGNSYCPKGTPISNATDSPDELVISGDSVQVAPDRATCVAAARDVGQATIMEKVMPCLLGSSKACCTGAQELIGAAAPMAYCLCEEDSAGFITDQTDQYNIDLASLLGGCSQWGIELPFFGNAQCPGHEPVFGGDEVDFPEAEMPADWWPTPRQCMSAVASIGWERVVGPLLECTNGREAECCGAIEQLTGPGGELEYCLCRDEMFEGIAGIAVGLGLPSSQARAFVSACPNVPAAFSGNCPRSRPVPVSNRMEGEPAMAMEQLQVGVEEEEEVGAADESREGSVPEAAEGADVPQREGENGPKLVPAWALIAIASAALAAVVSAVAGLAFARMRRAGAKATDASGGDPGTSQAGAGARDASPGSP